MKKIPPEASVTNDLKRVYMTLLFDKSKYRAGCMKEFAN
jgi:hypothetical protein